MSGLLMPHERLAVRFLPAEDIGHALTAAEAVVVDPVASVDEARRTLKGGPAADVALLDLNFSDGEATPVLAVLRPQRVPVVI
jgi:DNA-binding response OmpR family regulator